RYTLQAKTQADTSTFEIASLVDNPPVKWLEANGGELTIAYDRWLHTLSEVEGVEDAGIKHATPDTLGDVLWADRPALPMRKIEVHPYGFAGELAIDTSARIADTLAETGATHTVLTDPASLAWVFNIRGSDVAHTPLALG